MTRENPGNLVTGSLTFSRATLDSELPQFFLELSRLYIDAYVGIRSPIKHSNSVSLVVLFLCESISTYLLETKDAYESGIDDKHEADDV